MLEAWSKHALMDLQVDAKGDLDVDLHHTVEDVGICLGKALREAVGDKKGIVRYGASFLPMDEALLHAAVDISGRPYLVFNVPLQRTRIANFDLDLLKDFFRAVAVNAEITLAPEHALRREPPPHRGGHLQGGRPRPRRGHPVESAHHGILPPREAVNGGLRTGRADAPMSAEGPKRPSATDRPGAIALTGAEAILSSSRAG